MKESEPENSIWKKIRSVGGLTLFWNLILAIGGLVLLIFVVGNGFLPELNLPSAISLRASVSLISLFLVFAILILTTTGGWLIYSWFKQWDSERRGQYSILLAMLSSAVVYAILSLYAGAPQIVQISAFGVLVFMIICSIGIGICRNKASYSCWTWCRIGKVGGFVVVVCSIGGLFAFYHAMVFVKLYQERPGVGDAVQWAQFGFWLYFQAVCIGMVASSPTPAALLKASGALGALGILLLLTLSNSSSFLTERMARTLGIGALPNVSLAVTKEGCQVLHALSGGLLCNPASDRLVYTVEPVTLRSRFGEQVLIEYSKEAPDASVAYEAVLQATEVLGWQRLGSASRAPRDTVPPNT